MTDLLPIFFITGVRGELFPDLMKGNQLTLRASTKTNRCAEKNRARVIPARSEITMLINDCRAPRRRYAVAGGPRKSQVWEVPSVAGGPRNLGVMLVSEPSVAGGP